MEKSRKSSNAFAHTSLSFLEGRSHHHRLSFSVGGEKKSVFPPSPLLKLNSRSEGDSARKKSRGREKRKNPNSAAPARFIRSRHLLPRVEISKELKEGEKILLLSPVWFEVYVGNKLHSLSVHSAQSPPSDSPAPVLEEDPI